jgi:hypothetical protein
VNASDGMSRRSFARGSAALVMLAAVPVSLAARPAAAAAWTRSRFTPWIGSTFRMAGAGDDVAVVLAEIGDLDPVARAQDEARFSLLFTAPAGHTPTGGIRTFSRDGFGAIDMFVTPVGPDSGDRPYEAIINRL